MLPKTMKAAVQHQLGQTLTLEEVPLPRPEEGQVLIKVAASGVCHTDLHAANGDWPVKPQTPFIPGHEGVGQVVALGANVSSRSEGDIVGVPWLHSACGICEYCLTGWETLCLNQQNTGYSVNGSFAEYMVAPAAFATRIPDGLDPIKAAPVLCAGVTTYKGLKETEVKPGEWVVIVGIGGLGHMAVQYAKAMGMKVAAVEVSNEKLAFAEKLGASLLVNAAEVDPVEKIQDEIGGAHGVLITAVTTEIFGQSIGMLRRGGTVALVGLPPGDFSTPIFDLVLKRLTVRGSIVGTCKDLDDSLRFVANGLVSSETETQPLEEINEIFTLLKNGRVQGRVVLKFS